jgi:hypothetical protein
MATQYIKLYALTLNGAIVTTSLLNEWMQNNPDKLKGDERWYQLRGGSAKRVFFKKGAATAEFNLMPPALQKAVKITEYVPSSE